MAAERSAQEIFDLLWGEREPPSRGPKPSLSVERIVEVAIEIADAEGLPGVSMRKVAERLGSTTMSLYRYVPSKDDLLELMLDAMAAPAPDPADMPEHWRDALAWWARQQYAVFREHPWIHQYPFLLPPMGPNNVAWMECAIQAILRSGLPARDAVAVLMVVTSYVMGETRQQLGLTHSERAIGVRYEDMGIVYARMLERVVADGRHPGLAEVVASGAFGNADDDPAGPEEEFEVGLQFILDGIDALVSRGPSDRRRTRR